MTELQEVLWRFSSGRASGLGQLTFQSMRYDRGREGGEAREPLAALMCASGMSFFQTEALRADTIASVQEPVAFMSGGEALDYVERRATTFIDSALASAERLSHDLKTCLMADFLTHAPRIAIRERLVLGKH
ncbi:hypothetical protein QFZ96_008129 [Paraburkholderia youngii]